MDKPTLNRPPRSKRAPEVVRHVDETMDAYRRVVDATRKEKPETGSRPGRGDDRP
jgi:hypothetical protein